MCDAATIRGVDGHQVLDRCYATRRQELVAVDRKPFVNLGGQRRQRINGKYTTSHREAFVRLLVGRVQGCFMKVIDAVNTRVDEYKSRGRDERYSKSIIHVIANTPFR